MVSCATVEIPKIHPGITLPATKDGIQVDTITGEITRTPAAEWAKKIPKAILLFPEDWAVLKSTSLNNCIKNSRCAESVGVLDGFFQTLDEQLKKLPHP